MTTSPRVLISLAVHEAPEVVESQIRNFLHFLEDPVIVIHVSRDFKIQAESDRVLINPTRLHTAWGTEILALIHILNVRYALKREHFDYVAFHSSNDLFVRRGVEAHIAEHKAGLGIGNIETWNWREWRHDRPLSRFLRKHGLDTPLNGQIEGSFYRTAIFIKMLKSLDQLEADVAWHKLEHSPQPKKKRSWAFYPREEVYFPTALAACGGHPSTKNYTYINWNQKLKLTIPEIEAIRRRDYQALPDIAVSPGVEFFSVKRVPRSLDDPIRKHIERLVS